MCCVVRERLHELAVLREHLLLRAGREGAFTNRQPRLAPLAPMASILGSKRLFPLLPAAGGVAYALPAAGLKSSRMLDLSGCNEELTACLLGAGCLALAHLGACASHFLPVSRARAFGLQGGTLR